MHKTLLFFVVFIMGIYLLPAANASDTGTAEELSGLNKVFENLQPRYGFRFRVNNPPNPKGNNGSGNAGGVNSATGKATLFAIAVGVAFLGFLF